MRYMLDTNILIYLIRNKPPQVARRLNALADKDSLCMSFVTYAELVKGAENSLYKTKTRQQLEGLTQLIEVNYELDAEICQHYAHQFTRLKQAGTPIGNNDLWIACHALACDMTLVTNNTREFERVEGLRLENWAE